jgi:thiamine pyrophosphate-dependent acetolactate synthase large subunit-like protein
VTDVAPYRHRRSYPPRDQCLGALAEELDRGRPDALVVVSLGGMIDEWHAVRPSDANFFNSAMGSSLPLATGLALARPNRLVVLLDTDGSLLMTLGALCTFARLRPRNLGVIVMDNESYAYTGGQPSATAGPADLVAIARGCGIEDAAEVVTADAFRAAAVALIERPVGAGFVVAKVSSETGHTRPRGFTRVEAMYRFVRQLERTEGVEILPNR